MSDEAAKKPPPREAASQSFPPDEIQILNQLIAHAMSSSCRELRVVARSRAFSSLARKVQVMRRRVQVLQQMREQQIRGGMGSTLPLYSQEYDDPGEHF